ncbi:unnamed protein product [Linum trigynum]|uniref:Uncharacterized protein n=1 Tax=Linum trigynum TaxID=586398 RepID=A0AAV2GSA2_9ROSI
MDKDDPARKDVNQEQEGNTGNAGGAMSREQQGRPRRHPKGFAISRSPKTKWTASLQRRNKGKEKVETWLSGMPVKKVVRNEATEGRAVGARGPEGEEDNSPIYEEKLVRPATPQPHRRRLLLEEETEDEVGPLFTSLQCTGQAGEGGNGADGREKTIPKLKAANVGSTRQQTSRRLVKASIARQSPNAEVADKTPKKMVEKKKQRTPRQGSKMMGIEKGNWVEVPVKEVVAVISSPTLDAPIQKRSPGVVSIETNPEGDGNRFEIRSRGQRPTSGHVQQVVRAFEARLSFGEPLSLTR